jgi:PPM family protein phosphatase
MVMRFSIAQESRRGGREYNEDRLGYWRSGEAALFAVADGLGGHAHGELAAQLAIDELGAAFAAQERRKLADPAVFLATAIHGAHAAILREAQARALRDSPRTCIVACLVQDGHAHWAHVGDCRLYVVRQGRILARTRDHSVVQRLVDEGRMREEAIAFHPERNRLLQCLGGGQAPRLDPAGILRLAKNDVVLLCSDGFWGPLTQRQLVQALLMPDLAQAVPQLASLAEARGGPQCDNVTVVALRWQQDEVAASETPRSAPPMPTTEVQDFTATDPDFLRMSDEDIEKAIAEIKAALRRNALG